MPALTATLTISPDLDEVVRAAEWAEGFAAGESLPPSVLFAIQLCLEEALSNVVRHGGAGGGIHLMLERHGESVFAIIEDRGEAFDPSNAPAPPPAASLEDVAVGGQGIHLMHTFAQQMDYRRLDGVNRLILRFDLPNATPVP